MKFRRILCIIIFLLVSSLASCGTKFIPKELQGFWQFQVAKKGEWNGMHIGENYVELWYDLAKLEKITKTNTGYIIEVDNLNMPDTVHVELLSVDSAIFKIRDYSFRCKRHDTNPDIKMLSAEKYINLYSKKWYKRISDKMESLGWENGTLQLGGKTWRIIWLGDYMNREYRAMIEHNGKYDLLYIMRYNGGKKIKITFNKLVTEFSKESTEGRSIYLASSYVYFRDSLRNNIENMSVDFELETHIPKNIKVCISPLFTSFNLKVVQGAVSSETEHIIKKIVRGDTIYDSGGLLSSFHTLDTAFVKTAKGGVKFSGQHDGLKYVTTRNKIELNKGTYRVRIFKSSYVRGKSLPYDSIAQSKIKYNKKAEAYNLNEYEHIWLTMTVENLQTDKKWIIGSIAIPGKDVMMDNSIWLFVEIYGTAINFIGRDNPNGLFYKDIPLVNVVYKNFQINDKKVTLDNIVIMPERDIVRSQLGRAIGNKEEGEVECEIGYKE